MGIGTITNPIVAAIFLKLLIFDGGGMWALIGLIIVVALFIQGTPGVIGWISK